MTNNYSNQQAEQIIIGTVIMNNDYFARIDDILEPKHFADENHQKIFEHLAKNLRESSVDSVTLKGFFDSELKVCGGSHYIPTLLAQASYIVSVREYAFIIIELWRKRILDKKFDDLKIKLGTQKTEEILNELDISLKEIDIGGETLQVYDGEEVSIEWEQFLKKEPMQPILTKFKNIDEYLGGGLYPERLYVLGAASGCGKTFLAQRLIINALQQKLGALFISMEMPKKSIFSRFLSILSGINSFRLMTNNIFPWEEERLSSGLADWKNFQKLFYIVDSSSLTAKNIEASLKKAKRKSKIDFVIIDYAQIMRLRDAKNINEASLIKENVTALADIAKKYKVAVLLLSQLTKATIGGAVGLGSLKGSGGLYEDADCVLAMWASDESQEKSSIKILKLEVLKNREGQLGSISIEFDGAKGDFKQVNF